TLLQADSVMIPGGIALAVDGTAFAVHDWDGDGRTELALLGGDTWWITDGTDRDKASFPVTPSKDQGP
ncbi:hypothetical protein ACWCRC_43575, partial [Streptomyces sp. NPDC001940]